MRAFDLDCQTLFPAWNTAHISEQITAVPAPGVIITFSHLVFDAAVTPLPALTLLLNLLLLVLVVRPIFETLAKAPADASAIKEICTAYNTAKGYTGKVSIGFLPSEFDFRLSHSLLTRSTLCMV